MTEVTAQVMSLAASLYKRAYEAGVEDHSTSKLPQPSEDFAKSYSLDDELVVGLPELYKVYRQGYRAGAPIVRSEVTLDDVRVMPYNMKLQYVKADPRFRYVGGSGFVFKAVTHPTIDEAYLYTKNYLENGGDNGTF